MATFTVSRGAPASAPPRPDAVVDTAHLDDAVRTVAGNRELWARTSPAQRADLLDRVVADTFAAGANWVADATRAKGIPSGSPAIGEEWHSGPALVARMARLLAASLRDIDSNGAPQLPSGMKDGPGNRIVVPAFPSGTYDRLVSPSTTGDVWMPP